MVRLLLLLAAVLALATPSRAENLNGASFDLPPGWRLVEKGAAATYRKDFPDEDGDGKGFGLLLVVGPSDEAVARFDANFEIMAGATGAEDDRDPIIEERGVNTNGHTMRYEIACCLERQEMRFDQTVVGIASPRKQMFFTLVTTELDDEAEDLADDEFATLIRSVRLPGDATGFALRPAPGDGGLDGPYTFLDSGLRPNVFGGMDFYAESRIRFFDPSGLFTTVMPRGGSVVEHCARTPDDCGTYGAKAGFLFGPGQIRLSGVQGDFAMLDIEVEPFLRRGDELKIGEQTWTAVRPIGDGTRFDGVWRYFWASSGTTAYSSGGVAVERTLTFRPDGTFLRQGWSGASSTIDTGGVTTGVTTGGDRPVSSGTYELRGHTMILSGGGKEEVLSIFAPDAGSDGLLVIDGSDYLKQD